VVAYLQITSSLRPSQNWTEVVSFSDAESCGGLLEMGGGGEGRGGNEYLTIFSQKKKRRRKKMMFTSVRALASSKSELANEMRTPSD
jgi:hypothetical protein